MDLKFLIIELSSLFKSSFIVSNYSLAKTNSGDTKYCMDKGLSVTFFYNPF